MDKDDSTNSTKQEAGTETTDNLELLKGQLPEDSLARVLLESRQLLPDDPDALQKVLDKRLEQLRGSYADTADQDD